METCWILVGMMGAGKSSVGRRLAEMSQREFVDTDLMLSNRLGRAIPHIFQIYGEGAFRDHETSILKSLEPGPMILSTGGGIVLREANWDEMRRLGTTIYLRAAPDVLIDRLRTSKKRRPLLEVENWEEQVRSILAKREPLYERAEVIVDLDTHDIQGAADIVWHALVQRNLI